MPRWLILTVLSILFIRAYYHNILMLIILLKIIKERRYKKPFKKVSRAVYSSIEKLIDRRLMSREAIRQLNTDTDIPEWAIHKSSELSPYDLEWIEHMEKKFKKEDFINSLPEAEIVYEIRDNTDSISNNGSSNLLTNSSTYSDIQENE